MKLKAWIKVATVISSVLLLSACTHRTVGSVDDANAAYADGASAAGAGADNGFSDDLATAARAGRVYYFDYDSNVVHDEDMPAIVKNANYLASHASARVLLEGNTDPRGSREYNVGLGERRAKAVASILLSKGVQPSQIRVVSYGAEKLASSGHSEQDYAQDRRVVLVYTQK